jgi:hypothetical protein
MWEQKKKKKRGLWRIPDSQIGLGRQRMGRKADLRRLSGWRRADDMYLARSGLLSPEVTWEAETWLRGSRSSGLPIRVVIAGRSEDMGCLRAIKCSKPNVFHSERCSGLIHAQNPFRCAFSIFFARNSNMFRAFEKIGFVDTIWFLLGLTRYQVVTKKVTVRCIKLVLNEKAHSLYHFLFFIYYFFYG